MNKELLGWVGEFRSNNGIDKNRLCGYLCHPPLCFGSRGLRGEGRWALYRRCIFFIFHFSWKTGTFMYFIGFSFILIHRICDQNKITVARAFDPNRRVRCYWSSPRLRLFIFVMRLIIDLSAGLLVFLFYFPSTWVRLPPKLATLGIKLGFFSSEIVMLYQPSRNHVGCIVYHIDSKWFRISSCYILIFVDFTSCYWLIS